MISQGHIYIYFPSVVNVPGRKASGLSYSLLCPQHMALGLAHDRHLWKQSGLKWKNRYLNVGLFKRNAEGRKRTMQENTTRKENSSWDINKLVWVEGRNIASLAGNTVHFLEELLEILFTKYIKEGGIWHQEQGKGESIDGIDKWDLQVNKQKARK